MKDDTSNDSPIDHSGCVSRPEFQFNHLAHTHEGERGMWLFPSEVRDVPQTPR